MLTKLITVVIILQHIQIIMLYTQTYTMFCINYITVKLKRNKNKMKNNDVNENYNVNIIIIPKSIV